MTFIGNQGKPVSEQLDPWNGHPDVRSSPRGQKAEIGRALSSSAKSSSCSRVKVIRMVSRLEGGGQHACYDRARTPGLRP